MAYKKLKSEIVELKAQSLDTEKRLSKLEKSGWLRLIFSILLNYFKENLNEFYKVVKVEIEELF